jgi:hypothetical protein
MLQRGDVGVEARADVLDVEHQRIEPFKLLGVGPARLAIERVDRQARLLVHRVRDVLLVELAADAVLGREERHQLKAPGLLEHIDGRPPLQVTPGVVGHQAHAQALQRGKARLLPHVDAVEHAGVGRRRRGLGVRRAGKGQRQQSHDAAQEGLAVRHGRAGNLLQAARSSRC